MKENQKGGKTAKGIKKNINKKDTHESYKETLFENKQMHHKIKTVRSQNHQLGSYEIKKVSLSCFDDKRYILKNGIECYAYGHYIIKQQISLYLFNISAFINLKKIFFLFNFLLINLSKIYSKNL